jgi:hypothetical protein
MTLYLSFSDYSSYLYRIQSPGTFYQPGCVPTASGVQLFCQDFHLHLWVLSRQDNRDMVGWFCARTTIQGSVGRETQRQTSDELTETIAPHPPK